MIHLFCHSASNFKGAGSSKNAHVQRARGVATRQASSSNPNAGVGSQPCQGRPNEGKPLETALLETRFLCPDTKNNIGYY